MTLEVVGVIQVTYLCLATIEDLDPIFHAIKYMSWSCGFWVPFLADIYTITRKVRPIGLTHSFLDNYNILALLVGVPLVSALVVFLVNKWKYRSTNERLMKLCRVLLIELVFYGLMFSSYVIVLSITLGFAHFLMMDEVMVAGLILNVLLLGVFFIFLIIQGKYPLVMGEFRSKFVEDRTVGKNFYVGVVLERIVTSFALAVLSFQHQTPLVALAFIPLLVVVIIKRPYKTDNLRVGLNYSIILVNITLLTLYTYIAESSPAYPLYAYATIVTLIVVALFYNGYYYFLDWRDIYEPTLGMQKEQLAAYIASNESKRNLKDNDEDDEVDSKEEPMTFRIKRDV